MEPAAQPIRILHIVGRMDRGGIETMLMNLYRSIDRTKVQFDFLAHYGKEADYNEEIRSLGGRIYEMPALKDGENVCYWRFFSYIRALHEFFREHREYQIIHGHMTNTASIYMPIARKYGVKCTIAHSHNTHGKAGLPGLVTDLLQRPIRRFATEWFACSEAAAHWFYPEDAVRSGKVRIIPNVIDASAFRYKEATRLEMRRELGLEGKLVIGNVALFRPEKNQAFLLPVLNEALKSCPNAVLLFVGCGSCEEDVKAQVKAMGLSERVRFLGSRPDVSRLMQAMDVFALPSLWEGLPLVGIEAQAAGLPCVVADTVTTELNICGKVHFLPLERSAGEWAKALIDAAGAPRTDEYEAICNAGFDRTATANWLQEFYLRKAGCYEQQR